MFVAVAIKAIGLVVPHHTYEELAGKLRVFDLTADHAEILIKAFMPEQHMEQWERPTYMGYYGCFPVMSNQYGF